MKHENFEALMGINNKMSLAVRGKHFVEAGQGKIAELGREASLKLVRFFVVGWDFKPSEIYPQLKRGKK